MLSYTHSYQLQLMVTDETDAINLTLCPSDYWHLLVLSSNEGQLLEQEVPQFKQVHQNRHLWWCCSSPQIHKCGWYPKLQEKTITALIGGIIATDVEKFHLHLQDKTQNATLSWWNLTSCSTKANITIKAENGEKVARYYCPQIVTQEFFTTISCTCGSTLDQDVSHMSTYLIEENLLKVT